MLNVIASMLGVILPTLRCSFKAVKHVLVDDVVLSLFLSD